MATTCRSYLLFLLLSTLTCRAAFVAIDFGSEWTKASLMSPGRPIDVLLNTDSKRKMQSVVAWNKEERSFGIDAFNLISAATIVEDAERHTCIVQRPDGSHWTVEELVGMQFMYIKQLAEQESGEKIAEAVVTVPPYYTQFERQAVVDALQIAGLKPIALINDGLAVAINYAMPRTFSEDEHHIIYDAGASSITATIVTFSAQPITTPGQILKSSKNATQVSVQSFGYDTVATGMELDRRLRDHLVQLFESSHQKPVRSNQRAMARLWKEAQRVKSVLSANADAVVRVESLLEGVDFKDSVSRAALENLAKDLRSRFSQPIVHALDAAGMTMANISSVILTGGISRIPMIRSAVQEIVGDKIAVSVNADEAAVLGAAFYGATTKSTWRTKDMRFQDTGAYDVQLKYRKESSSKELLTPVFTPRSRVGATSGKKLTFPKRTDDFAVTVSYKNMVRPDFPEDIMKVHFLDVADALANMTKVETIQPPHITAAFAYSDSGMITVEDAHMVAEIKDTSSTVNTSTEEQAENPLIKDEPKAPQRISTPLRVQVQHLSVTPMTEEGKVAARGRLASIVEKEAAKSHRDEAYNNLEGYLYRLRDLIDGDDDTPFKEFVQPKELLSLSKGLAEALDWLNDEADAADAQLLWKKRNDLEKIEQPVITRYKEGASGPSALKDLQKAHALARAFLMEARENRTLALEAGDPARFTEDELASVETTLDSSEEWLREGLTKQRALTKRDDPALRTADMESRGITLQKMVKSLEKKKVPRPKTTSAPRSTSESPASATDSAKDSEPTYDRDEL
ncbi:lumenal Hsp70 protein [Tulasnella sp. 332]|nr:lumenal Hsp70 protein [Tulasnella sp. 332]